MRAVTTFTIIVLLATALAQPTKPRDTSAVTTPAPNRSKETQMWLENANVLTQEIIDDGTANLPKYNDFVMNARLAAAWWKVDPKRARRYLDASSAIADDHKTETPVEGFKRLFVAVTVMQVITPLEYERSDAILDAILTQATRLGPQAKNEEEQRPRAYFAGLIVEVSSRYMKDNNERRAKLYRAMLNLGGENMTDVLLRDIYKSDVGLGDQLFAETTEDVSNHHAPLMALVDIAMMSIPSPDPMIPTVPVSTLLKERAVQVAAQSVDELLKQGFHEEDCNPALTLSIMEFLPDEAKARLAPLVDKCRHLTAERAEEEKKRAEMEEQVKSGGVDGILQFADAQADVQRRAEFKNLAVGMLIESDPERAIGILNDLSSDERAKLPWLEEQRDYLEPKAIKQIYAKRDFGGLQSLIDRSPAPSRTALWIAKTAQKKDPAYSASLLPTIVDRLGEGRLNQSEFYLDVVNYIFKVAKPMTPTVFLDAMKGINGGVEEFIRGQTPQPSKGFKRTSFWWQLEPAKLDPMLDVLDQRSTRLAIDSLKFPMARASMRLWLLNSELRAYETASKAKKSIAPKSPLN
jgi:hypothetical protein